VCASVCVCVSVSVCECVGERERERGEAGGAGWLAVSTTDTPSCCRLRPRAKTGGDLYRGTSLIRKRPPPLDPHMVLGMVLL